mgnify:CR=1 FL=1
MLRKHVHAEYTFGRVEPNGIVLPHLTRTIGVKFQQCGEKIGLLRELSNAASEVNSFQARTLLFDLENIIERTWGASS